jgi:hypothetical protein
MSRYPTLEKFNNAFKSVQRTLGSHSALFLFNPIEKNLNYNLNTIWSKQNDIASWKNLFLEVDGIGTSDCLFLEMDKESSASFTTRLQTTAHAGLGDLGEHSTVDLANSQYRSDVPNMVESNGGEFTTPLGGNTDSVAEGQKFVANIEPKIETGVRQLPDAVDTVGSLGLSQNIFELDLK